MKTPKRPDKRPSPGVALNIRNFPEDLRWACGAKANIRRQDLREFVIQVLRDATADVKLA